MANKTQPVRKQAGGGDLPFYGKLALVVVITIALSEAAPTFINWILVLILVGLILGHYTQFTFLTQALGTIGK